MQPGEKPAKEDVIVHNKPTKNCETAAVVTLKPTTTKRPMELPSKEPDSQNEDYGSPSSNSSASGEIEVGQYLEQMDASTCDLVVVV